MVVDGPAIAADLGLHPVTIRNWASAGHIKRRGRDGQGRTLYDYDEVEAYATRRVRAGAEDAGQ
jgi:DNA-binding transcriptional MerR regulator